MSIATSITLVEKLKHNNDNEAWNRFYELYAPLIVGFACQRGCSETTAKDILQETMCQLLQYVQRFDYNPQRGQFRSYLLRIVMSRISKHAANSLPTFPLNHLPNEPAIDIPDPNSVTPWNDFESLWRKNLMQLALKRVKAKVKPLTWKSFERYVLTEKQSADDVARELGVNKNMVYQHKNRVLELLKHEIKNLEHEVGDYETDDRILEQCDEKTVKTLFDNNRFPGDLEHFQFLRQSLHGHVIPNQTDAQLLVADSNEQTFINLKDRFSVGSEGGNQIRLQSPYVSRRHCIFVKNRRNWVLKDLCSRNGVFVNDMQVKEKVLVDGDIIQIGDRILIFLDGARTDQSTSK